MPILKKYNPEELKLIRFVNSEKDNSVLLDHYETQKHVLSQLQTISKDGSFNLKKVCFFDLKKAEAHLKQAENLTSLSAEQTLLINETGRVEAIWRSKQPSCVIIDKLKENTLFLFDLKTKESVCNMQHIVESEQRTRDCLNLKPFGYSQHLDGSKLTDMELKSIQKFIVSMRDLDIPTIDRFLQAVQHNSERDVFFVVSPVLATFIGVRLYFECYTMYKLTNNIRVLVEVSLYHSKLNNSFFHKLLKTTETFKLCANTLKSNVSLVNLDRAAESFNLFIDRRIVVPFCVCAFKTFSILSLTYGLGKLLSYSRFHDYLLDRLPKNK